VKLTALNRAGREWGTWDDITGWVLRDAQTLQIRYRNPRTPDLEIQLPNEVVGLYDDTPNVAWRSHR